MVFPVRRVGLAAGRLDCDIAASTGVYNGETVKKVLQMQDNVVWVCSAAYPKGPKYLGELTRRVCWQTS